MRGAGEEGPQLRPPVQDGAVRKVVPNFQPEQINHLEIVSFLHPRLVFQS
jgi:hypothetical protein